MKQYGLVPAIIVIVVGVIFSVSLLVPVVNDAIDDAKTIYNNESGFYSLIASDESGAVTGSIDENNVLTINGETISGTSQRSALMSDNFYLRYSGSAHTLNYWDADNSVMASISHVPVEFTAENGVLTYTDKSVEPEVTVTIPYTWFAYNTAQESDYRDIVTTGTAKTLYVNDITQIYSVGKLSDATGLVSINKGQLGKTYDGDDVTLTLTTHEVPNVRDVVSVQVSTGEVSDIKYNLTVDDTTTSAFTGNILVPYKVVGINEYPGEGYIELISVIPILVIVGILLGVIALLFARREY